MNRLTSIRVGFALASGDWLGGRNYLRNLFAAVQSLPGLPIVPVLFTGLNQEKADDFPGIELVRTSLLDRKSPAWVIRRTIARMTGHDLLLRRLLQRHSIATVSHSFHLDFDPGPNRAIRSIGWIADFQHVHMPEFFDAEECHSRDLQFASLCARSDKVIVSSECARRDLESFVPEYSSKAELLQFVASPAPVAFPAGLSELERQYRFQSPYFLLPNQFWAHKNHRVVISALKELKSQGQDFLVLATGSPKDARNPSFFPSLMQYAAECGVQNSFRVLGQIPFDHLVGLMRHAVAFINPSRFEGWSTTVEEAKSMGKQIVLSDIPVHREQAPERSFFFPPEEPRALAEAMRSAFADFNWQLDMQIQDAAQARFPARQQAFGQKYRHIVERSLGILPSTDIAPSNKSL